MSWSWRVGTVAGIGIFIHVTFLILIPFILMSEYSAGGTLQGALKSMALVAAIFGCIVLHELGHALTARRFGINTRDITLLPIGGVARLERMPEDPWQEFLVAIAGPAVNVAIAMVLAIVLLVTGSLSMVWDFEFIGGPFLGQLLLVNLFLVLFNLIPAFPMDGGRVLRALLAKTTGDYVKATQTAASVGQVVAILFGMVGLFTGQFMLIFIALFVYMGAQGESHMVQMRSVISGVPVRAAMMTRFKALDAAEPLSRAAEELLAGSQQDFPVLEQGRVVGLLDRTTLVKALSERPHETPISAVMHKDCRTVEDNEMLQATFDRMQEQGCRTLPVVRQGQLVGLVTLENVGELLMINAARQTQRQTSSQPSPDRMF
ncbi:MAG: site-2 protease family protein [Pirellulales bacterium]|nr:site-2 protease family protein [Pirellulales bacterium]